MHDRHSQPSGVGLPIPSEPTLPPLQLQTPSGSGALGWPTEPSVPTSPSQDSLRRIGRGFELSEDGDDEVSGAERRLEGRRPVDSDEEIQTGLWVNPYPAPREPAMAGMMVGERYRLEEPLGDGGMAKVHRVTHVGLGKTFALKLIQAEGQPEPRIRELFFREARTASLLDHPHIVQITDFGLDEILGSYIVMEYLQGETLRSRLRRSGPLPLALALPIVLQAAQALHYMHGREVIHCDVKSENVFLCRLPAVESPRVHVKLIDFGLSRPSASGVILADGEVGGTPDCIAPEQIRGAGPQPSVDIYALGVLLYEALTARTPFRGTARDLLLAHLHQPPPPPSSLLPAPLPPELERLVLDLLEKRPEDRPASMGDVVFRLRTLAEMLDLAEPRYRRALTGRMPGAQARELANLRAVFEHCPIPLFRVDAEGALLAANHAFCEFVHLAEDRVVGTYLGQTGLEQVFPYVGVRVAEAARLGDRAPLTHRATYHSAERGAITVKVVLVPEQGEGGRVTGFTGAVHPLGL